MSAVIARRLERRMQDIAISHETMSKCAASLRGQQGVFLTPELWLQSLVSEWKTDQIASGGLPDDPDTDFLSWLTLRCQTPFYVSPRAVRKAVVTHGPALTNEFVSVRWKQEVAWAHMMRASDNTRIIFLAATWLRSAQLNPAKSFLEMLDIFSRLNDPAYRKSPNLNLSVDEIFGSRTQGEWRPVWIRHAEQCFGKAASALRLTPAYLDMVKESRDQGLEMIRRKSGEQHAERIAQLRLARSYMTWRKAALLGLSSNDLLQTRDDFLDCIRDGRLMPEAAPLMQFVRFIGERHSRDRGEWLPEDDWCSPDWRDGLPEELRQMASPRSVVFRRWVESLAGRPVRNHGIDLGVFLHSARGRAGLD